MTRVCLAYLLALATGCEADRPEVRPSVLLITVDTLRPDALGWVADRNRTPAIDALAREGFAFRGAVTPTPLTLPAHASLLTSLLPRRHAARDNGQILSDRVTTLAERLAAAGYDTAAFVSGFPLRAVFGLDRGFAHYDDATTDGPGGIERRADATTERARAWLRTARGPWFLWVHYFDPHDPYEPHAEFPRPGPQGAYRSEVAFVDHWIGELRRAIEERRAGPVLTVFTSDHGESFGEHGETTHGFFLYDTTVLVPLVFHFPEALAPGASDLPARLTDVAPTILDLLGLPPLHPSDGASLGPILAGGEPPWPAAVLETLHPWLVYGWAPLTALRTAAWKLVDAPRRELYDLTQSPGEEKDLSRERPEVAAELQAVLAGFTTEPAPASRRPEEERTRAALEALGYLTTGEGSAPSELPDPKDRLAERRALLAAEALARTGRLREAVTAFDGVLEKEPTNRFALLRSGLALARAGDPHAAAGRFQRVVEIDPDHSDAQYALADALTKSGQLAPAAEAWRAVVRLQPRRAKAWANLGAVLGALGRGDEALAALAQAASLAPRDPQLLATVGLGERELGEKEAAAAHLEAAAALGPPDQFRLAATLGVLLDELGRPDAARPWLGRARPGDADFDAAQALLSVRGATPGP